MQKPEMTREQAENVVGLLEELGISGDPFEYEGENGKWGVEILGPSGKSFRYVYNYPNTLEVIDGLRPVR